MRPTRKTSLECCCSFLQKQSAWEERSEGNKESSCSFACLHGPGWTPFFTMGSNLYNATLQHCRCRDPFFLFFRPVFSILTKATASLQSRLHPPSPLPFQNRLMFRPGGAKQLNIMMLAAPWQIPGICMKRLAHMLVTPTKGKRGIGASETHSKPLSSLQT